MTEPTFNLNRAGLIAALEAQAAEDGYLPARAAIHLLTFTSLPGTAGFAAHLTPAERGYRVTDWDELLRDKKLRLTGSDVPMLELAASLAVGRRISLAGSLTGTLGWAHVARVMEAVAIRCGQQKFFTVQPTPELDRLRALQAELSGGGPRAAET